MKKIQIVLCLFFSIFLVACSTMTSKSTTSEDSNKKKNANMSSDANKNNKEDKKNEEIIKEKENKFDLPKERIDVSRTEEKSLYAVMRIKDAGDILLELYPNYAPETVANFQNLIAKGFYKNIIFHRVVPGFVIQGGDPKGDGTGGSEKTIKGEFISNDFYNPLPHARSVLSMARTEDPNSASSQFFIVLDSQTGSQLNGNYAAFGRVIFGMEVVDAIAKLPVAKGSEKPEPASVIEDVFFVKEENIKVFLEHKKIKLDFELPKIDETTKK